MLWDLTEATSWAGGQKPLRSLCDLWVWEHLLWISCQPPCSTCVFGQKHQMGKQQQSREVVRVGKREGSEGKAATGVMGELWEGGKEPVAWQGGHGSRGGRKRSRWRERQPWEEAGNHCSNLWKLRRKFFLHLVILPFLDILIRSLWWRSPMDTGYHTIRCIDLIDGSHWVHICCTDELLALVSASWWKQKGPEVGWCRIWQRLQKYSVLGKLHGHFLKNFINKHYEAYYNDVNGVSDRLLYLPITAWKQILQKKWVGQWKITPTNRGSYLLSLVNRPFSRSRNAIEIR